MHRLLKPSVAVRLHLAESALQGLLPDAIAFPTQTPHQLCASAWGLSETLLHAAPQSVLDDIERADAQWESNPYASAGL